MIFQFYVSNHFWNGIVVNDFTSFALKYVGYFTNEFTSFVPFQLDALFEIVFVFDTPEFLSEQFNNDV